uniref:Uncharacterized protein n=1 Tax=Meloidogyne enterolobii TaxID=390850 RepID=A0A6V7W729_MELEN|nr:unnamed protein product [Meloidogyne enterolobii]
MFIKITHIRNDHWKNTQKQKLIIKKFFDWFMECFRILNNLCLPFGHSNLSATWPLLN